jgi:hypothetical protein
MKKRSTFTDETNITELEIAPDGRVFVFGACPEVLRILDNLCLKDESLSRRIEPARNHETRSPQLKPMSYQTSPHPSEQEIDNNLLNMRQSRHMP